MLKEFKEFALKGNVLDLAVGIIIGAAFTAIVTSLVEDVIMPPIGVLLGGVDFSDWYLQLTNRDQTYPSLQAARAAGAAVIAFGAFLNAVIKFLIVAFAVFMLVKQVNNLRRLVERGEAAAPPPPPIEEVVLLGEIRDLLQKQASGCRPGRTRRICAMPVAGRRAVDGLHDAADARASRDPDGARHRPAAAEVDVDIDRRTTCSSGQPGCACAASCSSAARPRPGPIEAVSARAPGSAAGPTARTLAYRPVAPDQPRPLGPR